LSEFTKDDWSFRTSLLLLLSLSHLTGKAGLEVNSIDITLLKELSLMRILTKHPEGKSGVNISKDKYDIIKNHILNILKEDELTYTELTKKIEKQLANSFEGSISWYTVTVKLDLEARGLIERIPDTKPEKLRIKNR
jgi:hypothetical protein